MIELIENLVNSPQSRTVLQKKGLVKSPGEEKEVKGLKAVATDLSSTVKVLKRNHKNEGTAVVGALKSLAFGETEKENTCLLSVKVGFS